MNKVTVIYTPQCPSNAHFITEIGEWSRPYGVAFEAINIFAEYERAREYLGDTPVGRTKHLFVTVFIDDRWIPGHPGNPRFKEDFLRALEDTQ